MVQYRHLGDIQQASTAQKELEEAIHQESDVFDFLACHELEVQILATELDLFPEFEFEEKCKRVLTKQFDHHNKIRVRGLLATFESMNGAHERSIELRLENLKAHAFKSSLRSEKPFTLCHLTWECARANRVDLFDKYARELGVASSPEDFRQWSYNHHALVAGSVLLGKHEELWDFLHTPNATYFGVG